MGASQLPLADDHVTAITGAVVHAPNRLLAATDSYATVAVGLPDLQVRVTRHVL